MVWGDGQAPPEPLYPLHTEGVCVSSQQEPGLSSTPKQGKRRLCFVFTPACSWNRSWANFILIAALDNIENFLRSHLICPNGRCSVNNLAKWCLGTLPCSSSLWLIGAWVTPHSSADSIPGIVKGGEKLNTKELFNLFIFLFFHNCPFSLPTLLYFLSLTDGICLILT